MPVESLGSLQSSLKFFEVLAFEVFGVFEVLCLWGRQEPPRGWWGIYIVLIHFKKF
jgi:hypothetical protein